MQGEVYQINSKLETPNERGLPKTAIAFAQVTEKGIGGDFNRYRHEKKNDDLDQALLLMPIEMIDQLRREDIRWQITAGDLGENITTEGIPYDSIEVGKQYRIGDNVVIQITEPCTPCANLAVLPYVGKGRVVEFNKTLINRRGWYARVLHEGWIRTEDTIEELVSE